MLPQGRIRADPPIPKYSGRLAAYSRFHTSLSRTLFSEMNSQSPQRDYERSEIDILELPLVSIVDDDESLREALRSLIESVGFRTEVFSSGEDFLNSRSFSDTDCLIIDVRMPGMNGLQLQERLNAVHSLIPIIFISAHDDGEARSRALRAGAVDFLQKPLNEDDLLGAIDLCLKID